MLRLTASLFTLAFAFVASAQASAQIGEAAQKRIDLNNAQIASMEAKIKKNRDENALDSQRIANAKSIDSKINAAVALPQDNGRLADAKCKALDAIVGEVKGFTIKKPLDSHASDFKRRVRAAQDDIKKKTGLTCKQLDFLVDE